MSANMTISEIKWKIEREFVDLFPSEAPFICAKIEDENGYSLSNASLVGDFLTEGERIYALPERFGGAGPTTSNDGSNPEMALRGGGNTDDLLNMLRSL